MAKNYSKLEKEDLLKVIEKLEGRKKYGLIWDEEKTKERFEKESENALPVLKEVKGKEIKTDSAKPINLLIEGDNYHALSVLNYTHQGKIDVIYIDPPYNTGNEDFKYNDKYVNKEDAYRHSKWLSFMSKRLRLAKTLLKDGAPIFISIDDNELFQLKVLCDEIFGEKNFIANLVWENKEGGGSSDSKHFKVKHEYILVYSKNIELLIMNKEEITDQDAYTHSDEYEAERGKHKLIKLNSASIQYSKSLDYPIKAPNGNKIMPSFAHKKACWRWSKEKLEWGIENGFIKIDKDKKGNWVVYSKQYLNVDNENKPLERQKLPLGVIPFFSSTMAAKQLENIFHKKVFNYSKPYLLIEYLLEVSTNKDSVVLDFMAGSGTTGHSVLSLNHKDKGNRRFILCTNNENNICTDVCLPRIGYIVKGYKTLKNEKVAGLGGNLKYYKTTFVKNTISRDDMKMRITRECTEMLCLRESVFEEKKKKDDYRIFEQNGRVMAVYYALEREGLAELKKDLDKMSGDKMLYCFTLDPLGLDKEDFVKWNNVSLEPIPQKILDIYEQIYEY